MPHERFLVTGGQGFLGSWILQILCHQAETRVALFDLKQEERIMNQILTPEELARIEKYYGDISDPQLVLNCVEKFKPTHIIHLAGLQIPTCKSNPTLGGTVNVIGTLNVLEAAKSLSPVPSLVYASSAAVCGSQSEYNAGPIEDDYHHKPHTLYGVFKLANEGCARVYWESFKIGSVGLRPLTCFGVGREVGVTSAPTKAVKAMVLGRDKFRIPFGGTTGFSYVKDIANIFIGCARRLSTNPGCYAFNIRGTVATVDHFVSAVEQVLPSAKDKIEIGDQEIPIAYNTSQEELARYLDNNGGKDLETPLETAISELVQDFQRLAGANALHDNDLD